MAVGVVALESPRCFVCVSALCPCRSPAVRQTSRLEESLCAGGLGRFLWICSGPFLGQGSEGDSGRHEPFGRETTDRYIKGNRLHAVPMSV